MFYNRFTLREMLCSVIFDKSSMKKSFDLGVTFEEREKIKFILHYTFCKTTFYLIKFNFFLYIIASTNITFKKHFNNITLYNFIVLFYQNCHNNVHEMF